MSDHTPTPWEYRPHRHDDWGWIRGPKGDAEIGPLVATARSGAWENVEMLDENRRNKTDPYGANAAFIVKAVNNHETLLRTLQHIAAMRALPDDRANRITLVAAIEMARTALSAVKAISNVVGSVKASGGDNG
jgi:hypothetical protein